MRKLIVVFIMLMMALSLAGGPEISTLRVKPTVRGQSINCIEVVFTAKTKTRSLSKNPDLSDDFMQKFYCISASCDKGGNIISYTGTAPIEFEDHIKKYTDGVKIISLKYITKSILINAGAQ
jgi:hypothetical protein